MDVLTESLRAVFLAVIAVGALGLAVSQIWRHILHPSWRAMKALVQLADAMPVLLSIAEEFRPNAGGSLRDAVDRIEQSQSRLAQGHVELARRIDAIEAT